MFLENWTTCLGPVLERINMWRQWLKRTLIKTWIEKDIRNVVLNH